MANAAPHPELQRVQWQLQHAHPVALCLRARARTHAEDATVPLTYVECEIMPILLSLVFIQTRNRNLRQYGADYLIRNACHPRNMFLARLLFMLAEFSVNEGEL